MSNIPVTSEVSIQNIIKGMRTRRRRDFDYNESKSLKYNGCAIRKRKTLTKYFRKEKQDCSYQKNEYIKVLKCK